MKGETCVRAAPGFNCRTVPLVSNFTHARFSAVKGGLLQMPCGQLLTAINAIGPNNIGELLEKQKRRGQFKKKKKKLHTEHMLECLGRSPLKTVTE